MKFFKMMLLSAVIASLGSANAMQRIRRNQDQPRTGQDQCIKRLQIDCRSDDQGTPKQKLGWVQNFVLSNISEVKKNAPAVVAFQEEAESLLRLSDISPEALEAFIQKHKAVLLGLFPESINVITSTDGFFPGEPVEGIDIRCLGVAALLVISLVVKALLWNTISCHDEL